MPTVIVQTAAGPDGPPTVRHLDPGQRLTFGRGGPGAPVDLRLPHAAVSRLAGEIVVADDYWLISNYSGARTYVVDNPQGAGEHIKIAPRRLCAPVPFEFARVAIPVDDGVVEFLVYAPEHSYADALGADPGGERTAAAFSLDESAKYFVVLVALCEPRLRDGSSVAIPSVPEVVERLRPLAAFRDLTRTAANFHIDYLAVTKLRIRERTAGPVDEGARLEWKREALVATALRYDLVGVEHLALLPQRLPVRRRDRAEGSDTVGSPIDGR